MVSIPAMTIRALQKDLNPSIGRVTRLMARWSCWICAGAGGNLRPYHKALLIELIRKSSMGWIVVYAYCNRTAQRHDIGGLNPSLPKALLDI